LAYAKTKINDLTVRLNEYEGEMSDAIEQYKTKINGMMG
jgi:hypothetical protein